MEIALNIIINFLMVGFAFLAGFTYSKSRYYRTLARNSERKLEAVKVFRDSVEADHITEKQSIRIILRYFGASIDEWTEQFANAFYVELKKQTAKKGRRTAKAKATA